MDGLADRIRRAMDAAEGTAVEQARRCGFKTPTQLHNTVARLSERPDAVELATLRKIAGGLGVSFDWLVTGRDELAERALRAPRFSDLPNWPELLAEAQESTTAAPWVWDVVSQSRPVVPPGEVRAADVAWPVALPDGTVVLPIAPPRVRSGVRPKAAKRVDTQK